MAGDLQLGPAHGVHWEYSHCTTTVRWYGASRTIEVLCVHTVPTVPHHDWSAGNLYTDPNSCAEYLSTVAYRHALLLACNSWLPRLFEPRARARHREDVPFVIAIEYELRTLALEIQTNFLILEPQSKTCRPAVDYIITSHGSVGI